MERPFKAAMPAFLRAFFRNDRSKVGIAALKGRSTAAALLRL